MVSAARAVLFAYAAGLIVIVALLARAAQPVRLRRPTAADLGPALRVLRQGVLAGSQSLFTVAYSLAATALMATAGGQWLAGYGVAVRLELLLVPLIFGIGGSLIALVGARVGAGQRDQGVALAWRGAWLTMAMLSALGLLLAWQPWLWCTPVSSDPAVAGLCAEALRVLGPFYGWFGLGLCLYFASQGLNTLIWPVAGAVLRFGIVAAVLAVASAQTLTARASLGWIAAAMTSYGLLVALALWRGPWRRPAPAAP